MKWLGGIITSLILLGLSTIFVAYLQPIVRAIAPEDGLKAEVELSRWQARPEKGETITEKHSDEKMISDARRDSFLLRDFYDFAAVTIDNPSSKVVENIRIRFSDGSGRDGLIVSDDGLTKMTLKDAEDFKIPNMKPGDRVKVFFWGERQFPKVLVSDQMKTFSSSGPFVTKFSAPSDNYYFETEDSPFFKFVDNWAGLAIGSIFALTIFFMGIGLHLNEKYYKRLLSDDTFYTSEKDRYEVDPKKFTPTISE
ncbi:hypothetical protein D0Z70_15190 [Sphingobium terrigena]|uniref:Uncharacterized protein n=1 Tax=Sphingobium terrigena TaxID=2304063 RepID=A0A418YQT6_9SPHN|nr:hypothetical protein [Sphingobium terrigena]RJG53838.1 hypothetical protein D0Z70_15190 [Sphingobium terrigena]